MLITSYTWTKQEEEHDEVGEQQKQISGFLIIKQNWSTTIKFEQKIE